MKYFLSFYLHRQPKPCSPQFGRLMMGSFEVFYNLLKKFDRSSQKVRVADWCTALSWCGTADVNEERIIFICRQT